MQRATIDRKVNWLHDNGRIVWPAQVDNKKRASFVCGG